MGPQLRAVKLLLCKATKGEHRQQRCSPFSFFQAKILKRGDPTRAAKGNIVRKHFRLNQKKLTLAQQVLNASTENEAVELALDLAITERAANGITENAHREFLLSGARIRDVFGKLEA